MEITKEDFESQVKNKPSEKEYQEIYKEGKDTIRSRGMVSTQPAFMRPQTSNFEYLSINVDKIITQQMALVPEASLQAAYERRVKEKQFRVPIVQEAVGTPTNTTPPSSDPASPVDTPTEKQPEGTPPVDMPPVLEEPKANALLSRKDSNIKLVSFQEEKPAATQDEPAKTTEPEMKPESGSVLELSGQPTTTPALPTFPQTGANALSTDGVADSTPMRTKTFEEVKDQIARDEAMGPATKIIEDRISEIVGTMSIYESELKAHKQAIAQKDHKR